MEDNKVIDKYLSEVTEARLRAVLGITLHALRQIASTPRNRGAKRLALGAVNFAEELLPELNPGRF
jgi:hypothetical protein